MTYLTREDAQAVLEQAMTANAERIMHDQAWCDEMELELERSRSSLRIKTEEHQCCSEDLIRWRKSAEAAIQENVELRLSIDAPEQEHVAIYVRRDQLQQAQQSNFLCDLSIEPRRDRVPLYTAPPAPQARELRDDEAGYAAYQEDYFQHWGGRENPPTLSWGMTVNKSKWIAIARAVLAARGAA